MLKSSFLFILKAGIAVFSIYFIYSKVISRPDINELAENLERIFFRTENIFLSTVILFLMFVNWTLETVKWKLLLERISPSSWLTAYRSVLSGVTVSLFTPNRMGEFAGRVMHLKPGIRIKASIASIIGSMNQLMITIVAGGTGLIFTLPYYIHDNQPLLRVLVLLICAGLTAVIYFYFRIPGIHRLAESHTLFRKLVLYTRVFELYPSRELLNLSLLSLCRYMVFSIQFFLILNMFGVTLPFLVALRIISLIYLVMAVVPGIAITELTVRGSVALYFLSSLTGNSVGVLAATSLIWLVNLVFPAAVGALSVFYFRFNKQN